MGELEVLLALVLAAVLLAALGSGAARGPEVAMKTARTWDFQGDP